MNVNFYNNSSFVIEPSFVEALVISSLDFCSVKSSEVTIYFVDKSTICKLHEDFFNDPSLTDCISFPLDDPSEEGGILGEVFVCPEVAVDYAPETPLQEVALYIVHGLLHLLGYDDQTEEECVKMRAQEHYLLEKFGLLTV